MPSADVLMTDTGNEVCFSGPIHINEPGDKNKLPDTGEAAEASDALEASEGVHNNIQEHSESLERLPLASQKRRKRRATTLVPASDTQQGTKKTRRVRSPDWKTEETQTLIACKLQEKSWEDIAKIILSREAVQCRERWKTLQKSYRMIKGYCGDDKELSQVSKEDF